MKNINRTEAFKRLSEVEEILGLLDKELTPIENKLIANSNNTDYPTIFIFGCARSGTTVLHQYLIQNLHCIYPSNFISRFYYAPYLGGLYYKLFTELDKRDELLGNFSKKFNDQFFSSDLGKTKGILSPNEFWYFWRKHFPINKRGTIDVLNIENKEERLFRNSVYALQNLFKAPFITKGMIANNCIDQLERIFSKAVFVYIKRDLYSNAKSLYQARINYFNDPQKWYSFYPKDPHNYDTLSPEEQVVRQVIDTNKEIEESLSNCNPKRIVRVNYKSFCDKPYQIIEKIKNIENGIIEKGKMRPKKFDAIIKREINNHTDKIIKNIVNSFKDV